MTFSEATLGRHTSRAYGVFTPAGRRECRGSPASTGGGFINCTAGWFRKELKREAPRLPGWLTEGIPDYIRFYLYEPQTKGAEITARNLERAKYNASYRVTGNFHNWVSQKYDPNIVRKLNAAARAGACSEEVWKSATGKTSPELDAEWKQAHEERLAVATKKTPTPP